MNLKKKSKEQKLPKWFDGEHYSKGDTVKNPFSGETYELNGAELSMYDFIMGCSYTFEMCDKSGRDFNSQLLKDFDRGRDWFIKNNAKAYMVLLD